MGLCKNCKYSETYKERNNHKYTSGDEYLTFRKCNYLINDGADYLEARLDNELGYTGVDRIDVNDEFGCNKFEACDGKPDNLKSGKSPIQNITVSLPDDNQQREQSHIANFMLLVDEFIPSTHPIKHSSSYKAVKAICDCVMVKEFKFIEPFLMKAGSKFLGLGVGHKPPKVDCRVLSEDSYQELKKAYDLVRNSKKVDASENTLPIQNATVSLPDDKVVEDWYTKDFDAVPPQIWGEAPYCTHGDRVEEIKDAVHYFITGNER